MVKEEVVMNHEAIVDIPNVSIKPTVMGPKTKVRAIFRNLETPGANITFTFGTTRDMTTYFMEDGKIYTVTLELLEHLNKGCRYPVHAWRVNEDGTKSSVIGKNVRRFSMQPVEFVDPKYYKDWDESEMVEPSYMVR